LIVKQNNNVAHLLSTQIFMTKSRVDGSKAICLSLLGFLFEPHHDDPQSTNESIHAAWSDIEPVANHVQAIAARCSAQPSAYTVASAL
jgi:hypothetical protein